MTNNVENLHKIKEIILESSYDSFYRYSLWQFICQDAWALGTGRRSYFDHVMRHVRSPRFKIIDPLSLKTVDPTVITERDIQNFVGTRHGDGPGVNTTAPKLQVLDAYAKICAPDIASGFKIDSAQHAYADLKAKKIIKNFSSHILSEIDFFFSENEGVYLRQERPWASKLLIIKHLPKKAYAVLHIFVLNDSEYPPNDTDYTMDNVPSFDRYSGIIVPDLSGSCALEVQHAYSGRIETMECFFMSGQRLDFDVVRPRTHVKSQSAAKPSTIIIRGNGTRLSGEFSTIPENHKYYLLSRRLFDHFGERI